jgi:hypothetical protein
MQCTNPVTHMIQPGDTLYNLASRYRTTVNSLLDLNPGIEVYNLQIGTGLLVCPGEGAPVPPIAPLPPVTPVPPIGTLPEEPILPPQDVLRELLLFILRWIREQLGNNQAQSIIEALCNEWRNNNGNGNNGNNNGIRRR